MGEVEEKQTLLPIYSRNDHKDQLPMDKNAVVIKVKNNLEKRMMESVAADEFGSSGKTIKPSIYKIPKFMKDTKREAYKPQLVSFGPYHHGKERLVRMEQEKLKLFWQVVKGDLATCKLTLSKVSDILEDLYGEYDNLDENWRKDPAKFMEMMIIDACFILVFFSEDERYKCWLITLQPFIIRDIFLLENQLPFQLLELLYGILPIKKDQNITLTSLISRLWFVKKDELAIIEIERIMTGKKHILDMGRRAILHPTPITHKRDEIRDEIRKKSEGKDNNKNGDGKNDDFDLLMKRQVIIPRATLLHEVGIKFQKLSESESLEEVSFEKGVLKLPSLVIHDVTESNLLNVMAFEQLHDDVGNQVGSFIMLLNNLIDIDKDVELLSKHDIICNLLGNDEDAANVISVLGKRALLDFGNNITDVHRLVNDHYKKSWYRWFADLKQSYFQNPWTTISFIAAVFGFAILIIQVVYQVLGFHTKKY